LTAEGISVFEKSERFFSWVAIVLFRIFNFEISKKRNGFIDYQQSRFILNKK